ncbi:universal stress protein [Desulfopila sp. IMCC35006]|uniref:universal stress protein n=1 Tax=Desulfopila sp. IMCC35006 TaxID=2569542 RepID=UPI0010AC3FBB|nr:universal stress protein [Desulfopila sp. IMCC35006]TKB23271.1 universal stress protein [Desulfopila sp. IMCC35006]
MVKYKKVLLPVDGSVSSRRAMDNAVSLSKIMNLEIVLLYVTGAIPVVITGTPRQEAENSQKEEADVVLAPYREFLNDNKVSFNVMVVPAFRVWNRICKVAEEEKCDMIVMGSRGLGDWEGAMVGSVTHKVLAHCTIPVLVVR